MEIFTYVGALPIVLALAAFVAPLFSLKIRNRFFYAGYLIAFSALSLYYSMNVLIALYENGYKPIVYPFGGWPPPLGIVYEIDFLNGVLGFVASLIMFFVALYSLWYFTKLENGYEWLTTLLLILMSGIIGCLYTGDVFNFFVMLEVICISSYALVAFFRKRKWAIEASTSYAFIGALATTLFLLGAIYIYAAFGTLNMADVAAKSHGVVADALSAWSGVCRGYQCIGNIAVASAIAVALMLWALTFEAGIFPNNFWIPSAYSEAPTPASAMFAGIVDKVGTYGVLRLLFTLFTAYGSTLAFRLGSIEFRDAVLYMLSILGLVTGYLGAILMAFQRDVKRLLAYSTISHIGILFTVLAGGASVYSPRVAVLAVSALLFHMVTHAIGESLLFLGLGSFAVIAGSKRLDAMAGYGKLYPGMGLAIAMGAMSLLGVIPLAGFFSKYMLFLAMLEAGLLVHAVSIILISGISAVGYFRIVYTLFMLKPKERKETGLAWATSVCMLMAIALMALGIAFIAGYVVEPLTNGVANVVTREGVANYIQAANELAKILSG